MSSTVQNIQNNSHSNQKGQPVATLGKCQENINKTNKQNQAKEYQQYAQKKKTQFNNSNSQNRSSLPDNKKICIIVFAVAMIIVLVTAIVYTAKYRTIQQVDQINNKQKQFLLKPPDHFYTRHYHDATASAKTPSTVSAPSASSQKCNQQLPYNVLNERQTRLNYPLWFGKVGDNIYGQKYQSGHFIEKHVAVGGKCTTDQSIQGKTVFYDWNQVNKAFKKASLNTCPLLDLTRFSYQFQNKIANPNQYIKGIDCRSGSVRSFSKFFILYRKASRKPNPYQQQYITSNQLTIWTFYPKF